MELLVRFHCILQKYVLRRRRLITTNDEDLYEKSAFANHGQAARYKHEALGYNPDARTNAVIAKWALENLMNGTNLEQNARYYNKELADIHE